MGEEKSERGRGKVREAYTGLATWKKVLVVIALMAAGAGLALTIVGMNRSPEGAGVSETIDGVRSSFTGIDTEHVAREASLLYDKFAPHLWRAGVSFFIAFVIGFFFRQFVKTMATVVAIAVVGLFLLDYFDVVPVLPRIRASIDAHGGAIQEKGKALLHLVQTQLPASIVSVAGFVIGFSRK